jgi:ribonuclease-3
VPAVAERLGCRSGCGRRRRGRRAAGDRALAQTERVLASVIEAVIGACYLAFGYEATAEAVVEAFSPEIERRSSRRRTSSRRCRSAWRAAGRVVPTR